MMPNYALERSVECERKGNADAQPAQREFDGADTWTFIDD